MPEKAVLMSIHKQWLDKIISGEKILEVRGNFPTNLKPPFQVYLYETHNGGGCGKIRAVALCTGIFHLSKSDFESEESDAFLKASCLTQEQLAPFFWSKKMIYGWQVWDVQPADIALADVGAKRAPQGWQYCSILTHLDAAQKKSLFLQFEAFAIPHKEKYSYGWFEGVITKNGKVIAAEFSHLKTLMTLYGKTEKEVWKEMPVTASPLAWLSEKTGAVPVYENGYMQPGFLLSDEQRYVLTLLEKAGLSRNVRIA